VNGRVKYIIGLIVVLFILLTTPVGAVYDEPQIDAYATSKLVPAGQTYPLNVVIVNTGKHKIAERGGMANEITYNVSLNAYNVTVWLEGDENIDVKSGKVRIPVLPANAANTLTFLLSIPPNATGKHTLTLHVEYERVKFVDVTGNLSAQYEVYYAYDKEKKIFT
jgi:hypothetical protein